MSPDDFEVTTVDGKSAFRFTDPADDVWTLYESPIDRLLGVTRSHLGCRTLQVLKRHCEFDDAVISNIRHNRVPVPKRWILMLHDVSGLPIDTIRKLANLEPLAPRYQPLTSEQKA